jgi:O-antigen ligase
LRAGPTDVLVAALGLGWLIHCGVPAVRARFGHETRETRSRPNRARHEFAQRHPNAALIGGALAVYLGVILLSGAVASSRSDVLKEGLKWAEVLVVFGTGCALLAHAGRVRVMVWIMVLVGVVQALLGYAQWVLATGDLGPTGSTIRVFGTFGQPNPYAAYLNLSLPFALALALAGQRPRERWLAGGAAALLLGAQALANSRGALLGLAIAIAVLFVVAVGVERVAAVGVVAGTLVLGGAWIAHLIPTGVQARMLHALRIDGVSLSGPVNDANFSSVERLAHWVAGLRMFVAHPLLGVGAGNYGAAYPHFEVPGWSLSLGQAHDYYINAAAETGIVGLLAFVALTAAMLVVAWRGARWQSGSLRSRATGAVATAPRGADTPTPRDGSVPWMARAVATLGILGQRMRLAFTQGAEQRALALGVLGVLVAIAVHNVVDDVFVHGMELQMALCLALAVILARKSPTADIK